MSHIVHGQCSERGGEKKLAQSINACNAQTRDTQRQSYAHLRQRLKKPVVPFSVSVKQSILCDIASKNINVVTCLDYRHTDKVVYMLVCERLVQNDVAFCVSIFLSAFLSIVWHSSWHLIQLNYYHHYQWNKRLSRKMWPKTPNQQPVQQMKWYSFGCDGDRFFNDPLFVFLFPLSIWRNLNFRCQGEMYIANADDEIKTE